jgi:hypothetical protein
MDYEEIIEAIRQAGGGLSQDTAERRKQWFGMVVELPEDHRPLMQAGTA